ncbi:GIY-YIG nuclease family protein (plasmid) [Gordonia amicalis]|nr:GIY-YIG nuclease family protein [Gordonia amicalis]
MTVLNAIGKSVRLFLVDGTAGGLTTAEIMNWTGHVIAAARTDLPELLRRDETQRTGVYFLLGDDTEGTGTPSAYIGEGDDIGNRLRQHSRAEESGGKDFWTRVVVVTSKDMNLTKAHARYLEARFIDLALGARRSKLTNSTSPPPPQLPESDLSDMEYFIAQAKIVLPVLGVNLLRGSIQPETQEPGGNTESAGSATAGRPGIQLPEPDAAAFRLRNPRTGVDARARVVDGEFTVLKGSLAKGKWSEKLPEYAAGKLHAALLRDGTLRPTPSSELVVFADDHVFNSSSQAASVISGTSASGPREWREESSGLTFGDWQSNRIDQALQTRTTHSTGESSNLNL